MAALQKHLPTFNDSAGNGAFSEDAIRRALGPALKGQVPDATRPSASPHQFFTPLSVQSWARPATTETDGSAGSDASVPSAASLSSLIPQMGAVSQKQAEATKISAAVVKAQAEAAEAHAEALEAVRQAERDQAAQALEAARAAWATEEAGRLHDALKGIKDEMMATIGNAVSTVLRPVFDEACIARAMDSFLTSMEPLMGGDAPPLVEVHVPSDLSEALAKRLDSAPHVTITESDEPAIRAIADITLVEQSLRAWARALPSLSQTNAEAVGFAPAEPLEAQTTLPDPAADNPYASEAAREPAAIASTEPFPEEAASIATEASPEPIAEGAQWPIVRSSQLPISDPVDEGTATEAVGSGIEGTAAPIAEGPHAPVAETAPEAFAGKTLEPVSEVAEEVSVDVEPGDLVENGASTASEGNEDQDVNQTAPLGSDEPVNPKPSMALAERYRAPFPLDGPSEGER